MCHDGRRYREVRSAYQALEKPDLRAFSARFHGRIVSNASTPGTEGEHHRGDRMTPSLGTVCRETAVACGSETFHHVLVGDHHGASSLHPRSPVTAAFSGERGSTTPSTRTESTHTAKEWFV
jgi:hypothetical protein